MPIFYVSYKTIINITLCAPRRFIGPSSRISRLVITSSIRKLLRLGNAPQYQLEITKETILKMSDLRRARGYVKVRLTKLRTRMTQVNDETDTELDEEQAEVRLEKFRRYV